MEQSYKGASIWHEGKSEPRLLDWRARAVVPMRLVLLEEAAAARALAGGRRYRYWLSWWKEEEWK